LLINGDDMACRTTAEGYDMWKQLMQFMGPKESVGKTFFSRDFVEANSTTFRRLAEPLLREHETAAEMLAKARSGLSGGLPSSLSDPDCPQFFEQVCSVNMGLLRGLKRSGGAIGAADVVDDGRDGSIGARARELYRTAPASLRDRVMSEFVAEHGEVLHSLRLPWFVPESLGGVGLPAFWDTQTGVFRGPTYKDILVGGNILLNYRQQLRRGRSAVWRTHALAVARLPEMPEGAPSLSTDDRARAERVLGLMSVGVLLDSRIDLRQLFDARDQSGVNCLRVNERVWSRTVPLPKAVGRKYAPFVLADAKGEEPLPLVSEVVTGGER
jgi:hypothetical protein